MSDLILNWGVPIVYLVIAAVVCKRVAWRMAKKDRSYPRTKVKRPDSDDFIVGALIGVAWPLSLLYFIGKATLGRWMLADPEKPKEHCGTLSLEEAEQIVYGYRLEEQEQLCRIGEHRWVLAFKDDYRFVDQCKACGGSRSQYV